MIRAVIAAVLATMLIASTAVSQTVEETSFRDALTEYTVSQTLVAASMEEASFNGYEGLAMQALEEEIGNALDRWQSLVVESCAADWATTVEVFWMLNVGFMRELGTPEGEAMLNAMDGIGALVSYYQTNATVACELE